MSTGRSIHAGAVDQESGPSLGLRLGAVTAALGTFPFLMSFGLGLNGDVQYMVGGLNVAGHGLTGFVDTFIHRPLAYRFVIAALMDAVGAVGLRVANQVPFELAIRLVTVAACAALGLGLWRSLRDRLGNAEAVAVAGAISLTLALGPSWDFLQAEWVGIFFAALGIVAALLPARDDVAAALGGLCLALAVVVKLATAPLALIALLVLAVIDRRRAVAATIGSVAWAGIWLGSLLAMQTERHWLGDMASLNANSPLRVGLNVQELGGWWAAVGGRTVMLPVIALVPAATVLLCRLAGARWTRTLLACWVALIIFLAIAPLVAQGEGYTYHLAALPVASAGLVAFALTRWWRVTGSAPVVPLAALLALAGSGMVVLARSPASRALHRDQVTLALLVAELLLAGWALAARRAPAPGRSIRMAGTVLAAASVLALVPALAPASAFALDPRTSLYTNASWEATSRSVHVALQELSSMVGHDTPVLYMTYGGIAYAMNNPTDCRYPSPAWLKVAIRDRSIERFASYRDNVACLSSHVPQYMILQPGWLDIQELNPEVRQILDREYDCSAPLISHGYLACPRIR